ncbi:MAG: hypothetical protein Q9223_005595, partial [Gallowayella weberi]
MLQPRICLRQAQHLRSLLPYTSLRNYAEAQSIDHAPPPPLKATSTTQDVNPYESSIRPEDTPEAPFRLRTYKPRTPGVRHLRRPVNDHLHKGRAYLPLTFPRKGQHIGGRNNSGQIRVRHRGNGAKRRIRIVDFHRNAPGKHTVERIEYDPGRSAHIALVHNNATMEKSYIVATQGMRAGEQVESFRAGIPQQLLDSLGGSTDAGMIAAKTAWRGNCLPLHMIPTGTLVHNVGLKKGGKAQLCRSAGTFAMVVGSQKDEAEGVVADGTGQQQERQEKNVNTKGKHDLYVNIKLKSGE